MCKNIYMNTEHKLYHVTIIRDCNTNEIITKLIIPDKAGGLCNRFVHILIYLSIHPFACSQVNSKTVFRSK